MSLRIMKMIIMIISVCLVSPLMKYHPDIREAAGIQAEETRQEVETTEIESAREETAISVSDESEVMDETEPPVAERKSPSSETESTQHYAEEMKTESATEPETETHIPEAEIQYSKTTEPAPETVSETNAVIIPPETAQVIIEAETQPPHIHSWEEIIEIIHHEAEYQTIHYEQVTEKVWIEDHPAYDETYETTRLVGLHDICKGCGMDITASGMTFEEYDAHDRQHVLNGEDSSYYSEPFYETVTEIIHHEAEGHYENLVVQEAYDETILVSEAWDEQVISGYRCRECGAMK